MLEWLDEQAQWFTDCIIDIGENVYNTTEQLEQLITNLNAFIDMVSTYVLISGIAIFILLIMQAISLSNQKKMRLQLEALRSIIEENDLTS